MQARTELNVGNRPRSWRKPKGKRGKSKSPAIKETSKTVLPWNAKYEDKINVGPVFTGMTDKQYAKLSKKSKSFVTVHKIYSLYAKEYPVESEQLLDITTSKKNLQRLIARTRPNLLHETRGRGHGRLSTINAFRGRKLSQREQLPKLVIAQEMEHSGEDEATDLLRLRLASLELDEEYSSSDDRTSLARSGASSRSDYYSSPNPSFDYLGLERTRKLTVPPLVLRQESENSSNNGKSTKSPDDSF